MTRDVLRWSLLVALGVGCALLASALPAEAQQCVANSTDQNCTNSIALTAGIGDGGSLTLNNTSSGSITNPSLRTVSAIGNANVTNAGIIFGSNTAVQAGSTAIVNNSGTISGAFQGIAADTAFVTNS